MPAVRLLRIHHRLALGATAVAVLVTALAACGSEADRLLADLGGDDKVAASKAVGKAVDMGADSVSILESALSNGSAPLRSRAAQALCKNPALTDEIVPRLVAMLDDEAYIVRFRVAGNLGSVCTAHAVAARGLLDLLRKGESENHHVRLVALQSLASLPATAYPGDCVELLEPIVANDSPGLYAMRALTKLGAKAKSARPTIEALSATHLSVLARQVVDDALEAIPE